MHIKILIFRDTLKALNKERVIVKHYAHLAEPDTVRNFYENSIIAIDNMLKQVIGKELQEVMLFDMINDRESKQYLRDAYKALEDMNFLETMIAIRKAIFVEIEYEYDIVDWKDFEYGKGLSYLFHSIKGGLKAPHYTKNKQWIEENVKTPFEYIQIDSDKIKLDLLEWGINTNEFSNIRRLTPKVYRLKETAKWVVDKGLGGPQISTFEKISKYCFEKGISIIWKKQAHEALVVKHQYSTLGPTKLKTIKKVPVYQKASIRSKIDTEIEEGTILIVMGVIDKGLDDEVLNK